MEKMLITGGGGFFASRLGEYYRDKYEILSLTRKDLDIRDEQRTIEFVRNFKPDYVVHTAAVAATKFCDEHPDTAYDINVKGTLNVARGCELAGSKLVFISSEQVFNGNPESGPYTEEDIPVPDTTYGKNKLESEKNLKNMLEKLWILRFTWLFGFPERGKQITDNIMWSTVQTALSGRKSKIPANEYRGMTYAYDVIDQFHQIFEIPYGTYHIGSENNLSRYDVVCFILNEMGLGYRIADLIEKDTGKYKDHPRDIRISTAKIRKLGLDFSCTEDGIRRCIKDYGLKLA